MPRLVIFLILGAWFAIAVLLIVAKAVNRWSLRRQREREELRRIAEKWGRP